MLTTINWSLCISCILFLTLLASCVTFWTKNQASIQTPRVDLCRLFLSKMASGHGSGRDEYTMQKILERRNRSNIRKVLERNGRRLTAREIDIVNLCTRYPEQRYTLFTYYCGANCMQLNPYVLPNLPVPDHHQNHHHIQHQQTMGSSNVDTYSFPSPVAPFLFQLNADVNSANVHADEQPESSSRSTLPCCLLTDKPDQAPASANIGFNSAVSLIADTIVRSIRSRSNNGSSNEEDDEKCILGNTNTKKSSRKSSKKKKNRKKAGANSGPSKIQTNSDNNLSKKPCDSSDFSSSSSAETSLLHGNMGDQRVNSTTEILVQSFSNNSSGQCHDGDVNCSNSTHSSDEEEETELTFSKILKPKKDSTNEDESTLEEIEKPAVLAQNSGVRVGNDFTPVLPTRRERYGRSFRQHNSKPNRITADRGCSSNQSLTRQEKPSNVSSGNKLSVNIKHYTQRDSITETLIAHKSGENFETSSRTPDIKLDVKPSPTKLPICSRKDHVKSNNASNHPADECIFTKDDFPSLPHAGGNKKDVMIQMEDLKLPRRDNSKKPPIPLPMKTFQENKEPGSRDVNGNNLNIPILDVKIGEVQEPSIGSGSSSAGVCSPDSPKSSQLNQSSHTTGDPDALSKISYDDEIQLEADTSSPDSKEDHNVSQSSGDNSHNVAQSGCDTCSCDTIKGHNVSDSSGDNSLKKEEPIINVAKSGCDTCPFDLTNNAPRDSDTSTLGSSVCSHRTVSTLVLPSTDVPCRDIGGSKNVLAVCSSNLEEIVGPVWTANRVHQIAELVQATIHGPFADYELLCHYAAPTVDSPPHQIANVSLRKIWQWYEEPSCYALEVKGCLDRRSLEDFTTHFVPSLSAVQLFVQRDPSTSISGNLLNQKLKFSSSEEDMFGAGAAGSAQLVFEFFEHEQPYVRQTLFEKVKGLIGGVAQGRSHVHGDAQNLEQLQLAKLHPASWYSVAWYPAYRVPSGRSSFKAAFLTYHSLAQNVQGVAGPSNGGRIAASSFPVVGMVSYNTKEEFWFHERCQNSGDVMEQRLKSLKFTAAAMSRARVMRGDQFSVNHHPDFEFFESRQYPD